MYDIITYVIEQLWIKSLNFEEAIQNDTPQLLKNSTVFLASDLQYGLFFFTDKEVKVVEKLIAERNGKYYIKWQIRNKPILAKLEEIVRQLWIYKLINEYGYPR